MSWNKGTQTCIVYVGRVADPYPAEPVLVGCFFRDPDPAGPCINRDKYQTRSSNPYSALH